VFHVFGRRELPLLDHHRLARRTRGNEQIGLAAKERGHLQEVENLRGRRNLDRFVDVADHRQVELAPYLLQNFQVLLDAEAAERLDRGAVGLVVARLEDEVDRQIRGDLLEALGDAEDTVAALHHARSREQKQAPVFE